MQKVSKISVVFFSNLPHANDWSDTWETVSYGDAAYTLVPPEVLIDELNNRFPNQFRDLIKNLSAVALASTHKNKIYIALDG